MKKIISIVLILCTLTSVPLGAEEIDLDVSAKSALLMEADTGKILYEENSHEKLAPASVTKIMTMLLTMEAIDSGKLKYDEMVITSERAKSMGGSTIFLETNEQMSVYDLLKGIAVASANDACVAIGEHIAGSEQEFVKKMNDRAKELGMNDTHFVNTNGLDAPEHYTSAHDIALMSRELLKHEDIFKFTTIWMDSLRDGKFQLANTNRLIRFYEGANGLKTGSTSGAGCCISATAKRNDMQLIAVVMGSPTSNERFESAKALLDYGFANYLVYKGIPRGNAVGESKVYKGKTETVEGVSKDDFSALIKKGEQGDITNEVMMEEEISAPIYKEQKIGEIKYKKAGEIIGSVDVVAKNECLKLSPMQIFYYMLRLSMFHK